MAKVEIDYDKEYSNEYIFRYNEHLNELKIHLQEETDFANWHFKLEIIKILNQKLEKLKGKREGQTIYTDKYFQYVLDDLINFKNKYRKNPVSNFIANKLPILRKELEKEKHIKPELYKLSEELLVKYAANFLSLLDVHDKFNSIKWNENESWESIYKKMADEKHIESDVEIEHYKSLVKNEHIEEIRNNKINAKINTPTVRAAVFHFLESADYDGFIKNPESIHGYYLKLKITSINESTLTRIIYDFPKRLEKIGLTSLLAVERILQGYNCDKALKNVKKEIKRHNECDDNRK